MSAAASRLHAVMCSVQEISVLFIQAYIKVVIFDSNEACGKLYETLSLGGLTIPFRGSGVWDLVGRAGKGSPALRERSLFPQLISMVIVV